MEQFKLIEIDVDNQKVRNTATSIPVNVLHTGSFTECETKRIKYQQENPRKLYKVVPLINN